jgi:hypothetical protein
MHYSRKVKRKVGKTGVRDWGLGVREEGKNRIQKSGARR